MELIHERETDSNLDKEFKTVESFSSFDEAI